MEDKMLLEKAIEARAYAYAPYSGFKVGAALLAEDGRVFYGCNIENAAYTPTNCAERTAFFKAVSEGVKSFKAIAIAGGRDNDTQAPCTPCGVCRQVMAEFCRPEYFRIITADGRGGAKSYTLSQLLPESFGPQNL